MTMSVPAAPIAMSPVAAAMGCIVQAVTDHPDVNISIAIG
jgi:hypothetical protein